MSDLMKLYPLGYVFSDQELENIPGHYDKKIIQNRYFYYYDVDINPNIYMNEDAFILIHGEFVHVGIEEEMNKNELLEGLLDYYQNNYNKFLDTLDYIGGRFVIFIGDNENVEFYPDAANTRTTYYTTEHNIFSSHVALIRDNVNKNKSDRITKSLATLNNALYYTTYNNIRSSLPNFKIHFKSKEYLRFFPREKNKFTELPEKEKYELFEHFWNKQLEYYFKNYTNFLFSISGGGDSRFAMSFLKNHLDKVQFFTYTTTREDDYTTPKSKGLTLDRKIVEQILDNIDLKHKFIYYEDNQRSLTSEENFLLSKNTIAKHTPFLISHIKDNYPQENLKHIRGNLFEIGQTRNFRNQFKESNSTELKRAFEMRYKKNIPDEYEEKFSNLYEEFIENLNYMENVYDYHLLDLFHWEIRMGRWHPEILNTHDIVFDTINPFNHRAIIDISLSFPYEKRRDEYLFKELINRNYPILNFFGDNNEKNLYEQQRNNIYKS